MFKTINRVMEESKMRYARMYLTSKIVDRDDDVGRVIDRVEEVLGSGSIQMSDFSDSTSRTTKGELTVEISDSEVYEEDIRSSLAENGIKVVNFDEFPEF